MHKIYDYICDELEKLEKEIERTGELTPTKLELADDLIDMKKNITKIWRLEEDGDYSHGMYPDRVMRDNGMSMARGRRDVNRDAMGRYSRKGDIIDRLHDIADNAPDEMSRREINKLISKMQEM